MQIKISKFSIYEPSHENPSELPKLEYCDPLFKRRLSQISRMTIEAVHGLGEGVTECKLVFASFRGEINRQQKINKSLAEDADVLPAQFSISVFNTPPAVTTIALKMKKGYTAIYPAQNNFRSAFMAACAPVLCGEEEKIIFAYADEVIPEELKNCKNSSDSFPVAFACVITNSGEGKEIDFNSPELNSPESFMFYLKKENS